MSRFQPIGVPDPNNVPVPADVSLTQTSFVAPAPSQNLDALIQGLSAAVGIATENKNKKIQANIKLNEEQKLQYNEDAKIKLFKAEQKYNEANNAYAAAVASGDESLIAESKGSLLKAINEVGIETSRLADDDIIDLSIRKGAEDFSTGMFQTHSGIINASKEAQEKAERAETLRQINMSIEQQTAVLNQPHVMRTIIRSEQLTEGPPIPPAARFESFADMTYTAYAESVSQSTGLSGEDLEQYMNSPEVQSAIIRQTRQMMKTYDMEMEAVVKADTEAAFKDHLNNVTETAVFAGTSLTIADRSYIMDITGASKSEVDFKLSQKLSAMYGRADGFTAFNDTQGWFQAIETADNLGLGDLKGELTGQLVQVATDLFFENTADYYVLRKRVMDLYPDLDKMPRYLSEVKDIFKLNETDVIDFRSMKPGGAVTKFNADEVIDSTHRTVLKKAQELETEWNEAVTVGGVYVNQGTQMSPLIEGDQYSEAGLDLLQRYVGAQATLFLVGRDGLATTKDTVDVLARGLMQPSGPEEFLVTQEILNRNNAMRDRFFYELQTDEERYMAQHLLDLEVRSNPDPLAFQEALATAQRWAYTEFSTPAIDSKTMSKIIKELTPKLGGGSLTPEASSKIRLDYSKLYAQNPGSDPEDLYSEAFKKFTNEHMYIDGQWLPVSIGFPTKVETAIENIRNNLDNNFFNEETYISYLSEVSGRGTQIERKLNTDSLNPALTRWMGYMDSYEYQSVGDVLKATVSPFGFRKIFRSLTQPGHFLTGSRVVNGQVVDDREIAKAMIADRLLEKSDIMNQILQQTELQEEEVLEIYWTVASSMMGDNLILKRDGISVRTIELSIGNNETGLRFDIDRAGSLNPISIYISPNVYQDLANSNLAGNATRTYKTRKNHRLEP